MSEKDENQTYELIRLAMDSMPAAVSVIDAAGTLVYYNRQAAKLLDRKPEYIGTDIRGHHKRKSSNDSVDHMLGEFAKGRSEPFCYEAKPYGTPIAVTLTPLFAVGQFVGCIQSIRPTGDTDSK